MLKQPDYTTFAKFYDKFELEGTTETAELNAFLTEVFNKNNVSTVLDFACGTGAQALGLAKRGFKVTASDLDEGMLKVAVQKAKKAKLKIDFHKGNMKNAKYGTFDAVICIFNAIGHLTRLDCSKFFKNAYKSLNEYGLLVFDILNFEALKNKEIFELYRDFEAEAEVDNWLVRRVRDCTLNKRLKQVHIKSYTAWNDSIHFDSLIEDWNMQIYEAEELRDMLDLAGFSKIELFDQNGCRFDASKSGSIMIVAYR